jgi:hypothetical protein
MVFRRLQRFLSLRTDTARGGQHEAAPAEIRRASIAIEKPIEYSTPEAERPEPYSSDSPVRKPAGDRFGRWPFAQRVAQVIAGRRDPASIVVGIFGAWGEGKTTVLNFIEEELSRNDHVLIVHFNPWRFGDEDTLLRGFFFQLGARLEHSLITRGEEIGILIRKYVRPLAGVIGGEAVAEGAADLLGEADLEKLRDRIGKVLRMQASASSFSLMTSTG